VNTLPAFFDKQVSRFGGRPAMQHRPRYRSLLWSYEHLGQRVRGLAGALSEGGVCKGDRVLLFAENSPDWAAAYFAILARGACAVPLNPRSTAMQIESLIAVAEPKMLMRSDHTIWPASPLPFISIQAVRPGQEISAEQAIEPEDLAEIIFTSGTTGDPKGVMLTHGNLLADLDGVFEAVPLGPHHHVVSLVPLFHAYGQMTSLLCPLRAGCAVTYLGTLTSRAILDAFGQVPATHLVAVPEVLKTLMDRLEVRMGRIPGYARRFVWNFIRRRVFGRLQTIVCGGAALDPVVEEKWRALGFDVLQGYGLTEASPVVATNTARNHRLGSVGKPLPGVEIKVAADGEVLVRGPMVMPGYYRDKGRTEAAFVDGWYKTDDAGRFDDDGFLYVLGRKRYMILGPGGENVFPEDIENELNRHPGIIDSAVIGLEKFGRTVIHAVLLGEAELADKAVFSANQRLAPHQRIISWTLWPEPDFPRSATRKVRKEEIIQKVSGQVDNRERPVPGVTPIRRLLSQLTGSPLDVIDGTTRLVADLGIDSLLRIELVSRIEDQFGIAIEELQITVETTVSALEALLLHHTRLAVRLGSYPRWSVGPVARMLRPWVQRLLIQSWISLCCHLRVEGAKHLEDLEGPVIFMANHRSFLDSPVATFALPSPWRWRIGVAAATEVLYRNYRWAIPLGELGLNAFPFPTEVDENIRPGLDYIGRLIDDGWSVLIFPEGSMNRSGLGIQPLKGGAGVIAVEMGVPIVPMVIEGTEMIMPPGTLKLQRRGNVTVRFGEPVTLTHGKTYGAATAHIEQCLRELLNRDEPSAGKVFGKATPVV